MYTKLWLQTGGPQNIIPGALIGSWGRKLETPVLKSHLGKVFKVR